MIQKEYIKIKVFTLKIEKSALFKILLLTNSVSLSPYSQIHFPSTKTARAYPCTPQHNQYESFL